MVMSWDVRQELGAGRKAGKQIEVGCDLAGGVERGAGEGAGFVG